MYKLVVFTALLAVAAAAPGLYGAPIVSPYGLVGAPVVKTAVPVATSYANTVRLASPSVAVAPAPYAVAPASYAVAPSPYAVAPSPYAVAQAPVLASPYGHAW